jgi:hypothetical protein
VGLTQLPAQRVPGAVSPRVKRLGLQADRSAPSVADGTILQLPRSSSWRSDKNKFVRFEVFTAVTMKNGVFWDVTPCGSCENRRFGRT